MHHWREIRLDQLRRRDLLRRANAERAARDAERRVPSLSRRVAAWTGLRAVALGLYLLRLSKNWEPGANDGYNSADALFTMSSLHVRTAIQPRPDRH